MTAHVGYRRVSTVDQNTGRQLTDINVKLDRVFEDKVSAKDTKRPQLQECLRYLREGDTLHVHSIDRLARNLGDLERLVTDLTGRGVTIQFHKEALTFGNANSPMNTLMLQLLGAISQFERSLILERQREGIAQAQKAGKYTKPPKLTDEQVAQLKARIAAGEPKKAIAADLGISRQTLYNYVPVAQQ